MIGKARLWLSTRFRSVVASLHPRPLGRRLLMAIIVASGSLSVGTTGIQLYQDYRQDMQQIEAEFDQIRATYADSIANSLWTFDTRQIQLSLDSLLRLPDVRYAAIVSSTREHYVAGTRPTARFLAHDLTIAHPSDPQASLGVLTVVIGLDGLYRRLLDKAFLIFAAQSVKAFVISLLLLFLVNRWITRPLANLARYAANLKLAEFPSGTPLGRRRQSRPDELDQVADALVQMVHTLHEELLHRANLEQEKVRLYDALKIHRDRLEDEVTERTSELRNERNLAQQRGDQLAAAMAELKRAQEQLVLSEKLASVGVLTAGVAHEINNPVNFAHASAQTLEANLELFRAHLLALATDEADPEVLADLNSNIDRLKDQTAIILEGTVRIRDVVRNLRTFSRLDEAEWKTVRVSECLDSTIRLVRTQFSHSVNIDCTMDQDPDLYCRPSQLNQVFLNIIINACQAIEARGKRNPAPGGGRLRIHGYANGDMLAIDFEDNGIGMAKPVCDHVFEPFFTTKEVGSGTGLGLAISFGIIEQHGGALTVRSTEGIGSCFTVSLPTTVPPTVARGDHGSRAKTPLPLPPLQ